MENDRIKIDIGQFVFNSKYIYLICSLARPGVATFISYLEQKYFNPEIEEVNDLFTIYLTNYGGIPYAVVGVPTEYLTDCKNLADKLKLKLANGIPLIKNGTENKHFPIDHSYDLTFTLENIESYTQDQITKLLLIEKKKLTGC